MPRCLDVVRSAGTVRRPGRSKLLLERSRSPARTCFRRYKVESTAVAPGSAERAWQPDRRPPPPSVATAQLAEDGGALYAQEAEFLQWQFLANLEQDAYDYPRQCKPLLARTLADAGVRTRPGPRGDSETGSTEGALSPGRCIFRGYQGSVFEVEHRRRAGGGASIVGSIWEPAALKAPHGSKLCITTNATAGRGAAQPSSSSDAPPSLSPEAGDEQLWICVPERGEDGDEGGYFLLYSKALGSKVLEVQTSSRQGSAAPAGYPEAAASDVGVVPPQDVHVLALSEGAQRSSEAADHQKWRLDGGSRLVSKLRRQPGEEASTVLCLDVCENRDEDGAAVVVYKSNENANQRWSLDVLFAGVGFCIVRIVSALAGRRSLTVENGDMIRRESVFEVYRLARWAEQPGLVQLRSVVWSASMPTAIILERLGKQLGRGTGPEDQDCILRDMRQGSVVFSLAAVAHSLLPVARFLRHLHLDGFSFNDLHDGNILRQLHRDGFKVIDLGGVTRADHWASVLGPAYDSAWSTSRDWRAFAVAMLGLTDCGKQLSLWDLVGTNIDTRSPTGGPLPWLPSLHKEVLQMPIEVGSSLERGRSMWTTDEFRALQAVWVTLFASRVDHNDICAKLEYLATTGSGEDGI